MAYLGEVSLAVADEQAGLAASAIADDDNLLGVGRALRHVGGRRLAAGRASVAAHHGAHCSIARPRAARVSSVRSRGWLALNIALILFAGGLVVGVAIWMRRSHDTPSLYCLCGQWVSFAMVVDAR